MSVWTTLPETELRVKEWINILDASFRGVNLREKKCMVLSLVIYWKELTRPKEMEYHNHIVLEDKISLLSILAHIDLQIICTPYHNSSKPGFKIHIEI